MEGYKDVKVPKYNKINSKSELNRTNKKTSKTLNFKPYFGFNFRVIFFIIIFFTFTLFSTYFIINSFSVKEEKEVVYNEKSNIDYKVYLKENEFYDTPYINKDSISDGELMLVSSLIDTIHIDFDYLFNIDDLINMTYKYNIEGKLIISDQKGDQKYYEKNYIYKKDITETIQNQSSFAMKDQVIINYDYYNDIVNNFKSQYGVDITGNLIISLKLKKQNDIQADKIKINENSDMLLIIPLSEKSINIKMTYKDINSKKNIVSKSGVKVSNNINVYLAIISSGIAIFSIVKLIKLLSTIKKKKTKYDLYIDKKLLEYDRLIVETNTCPSFTNLNVIKIKKFEELIDVRDNLKKPILYYNLIPHQKCYFYIKHENDLYLLVIKSIDIDGDKK